MHNNYHDNDRWPHIMIPDDDDDDDHRPMLSTRDLRDEKLVSDLVMAQFLVVGPRAPTRRTQAREDRSRRIRDWAIYDQTLCGWAIYDQTLRDCAIYDQILRDRSIFCRRLCGADTPSPGNQTSFPSPFPDNRPNRGPNFWLDMSLAWREQAQRGVILLILFRRNLSNHT
jgi:hypothetical protein